MGPEAPGGGGCHLQGKQPAHSLACLGHKVAARKETHVEALRRKKSVSFHHEFVAVKGKTQFDFSCFSFIKKRGGDGRCLYIKIKCIL